MKKKHLEMILQRIPSNPSPDPILEQYQTPATMAADILFIAYKDIKNKIVADFGCGTGIFSIGTALLGAKKVFGIDVDEKALEIAEKQAMEHGAKIEFICSIIEDFFEKCDTVITNPPFGAQLASRDADKAFLKKGLECAPIVYFLHLTKTGDFIKNLVKSLNATITYSKEYLFPIPHQFDFHKKKMVRYPVTLFRIERI